MGKAAKRIAAGLAILATVLLVHAAWLDNGPAYKGRSLASWLKAYEEEGTRAVAKDALQHIGTNAVPYALKWMQRDDEDFTFDDEKEPRGRSDRCVWVFEVLGTRAAFAIPQLQALHAHPIAGGRAINSLAFIGDAALPALVSIAGDTNAPLHTFAIDRLEDFGTNAVPPLHAIIMATPADKESAMHALDTLIRIGPPWASISNVVAIQLHNPEVLMRLRALNAMVKYCHDKEVLRASLQDLLHDEHPKVRFRAQRRLQRMQS